MVTPAGQNASVVLTFTTRDNASPGIQRIGANLTRLQSTAAGVGKVFAQNSTAFIGAGLALATAGAQVAQLGVKFGLLNEKQGEILGTSLQVAGVFFTMTGAIAQVIATATGMGLTLAIITGSLAAMAATVLFLVSTFAALGAIITSIQGIFDPSKPLLIERILPESIQRLVPGGGSEARARSAGRGANIGGLINRATEPNVAGNSVILNIGTMIADEFGLRELERRLRNVRGEEQRTRGNTR